MLLFGDKSTRNLWVQTWRDPVTNQAMRQQVIYVFIAALTLVASGCKRTDNGNPGAMNSGSSGVMSNSARENGMAGSSDVAKRADRSAGAAASPTNAVSSQAAVVSKPASTANQ